MSMSIGSRFKQAREAKGLTREQAAQLIMPHIEFEASAAMLREIEEDEIIINAADLVFIANGCRVLRVSPAWLLGMVDRPPESYIGDLIESAEWREILSHCLDVKSELVIMQKIGAVLRASHGIQEAERI